MKAMVLLTASRNDWLTVPAALLAVIVSAYVPWLPDAGVPDRVAVPLPLSLKVTPEGRAGLLAAAIVAVGAPVVVTVNVPALPTVNVVDAPLVIAGACCTVTVSVCCAVPYALTAASAMVYVPGVVGVPDNVAVPSPLLVNVMPGGTFDPVRPAAGYPLVVTLNVPVVP